VPAVPLIPFVLHVPAVLRAPAMTLIDSPPKNIVDNFIWLCHRNLVNKNIPPKIYFEINLFQFKINLYL